MARDPVHPAIDAKAFAEMLGICSKLAGMYIAAHPRRIKIGKGQIRQTFRLPYENAVAIATGMEALPPLDKPRRVKAERPATPKTIKPPKASKNAPRAANGCLYGVPRRTKEV